MPTKRRPKAKAKRARRNPPIAIFGNPGAELMGEVVEIRYKHKADGKYYKHPFNRGVLMYANRNGTLSIRQKDGKPLHEEF